MTAEPATALAVESWPSHPVYARYWQHYHQAMAWMRCHQNAYRKAMESCFMSPWYSSAMGLPQSAYAKEGRRPQSCYEHPPASWDSHHSHSHAGGRGPHPRGREEPAWYAEEEKEKESESDDGGIECDVSNMEITEELRQYFAQTERHQEERRRQQQLDAARLNDYVNADHDLYRDTRRRSVLPPAERPGERRRAEMRHLYGASAAKIQAMEAAVQLSFDKHCDRKQPKYWPVIPLKF
ncbi:gem-associated protein 8 [Delphinus delphis]|uniref:Gem-associated protein 8 n=1 Tax=Tursiops truncatus TaxID=9739 RepID=A0A2U4AJJ9_TURTR|nr:gem-associated protein 8 [Tursiops truncatus]XP_019781160.1 gem-associated protein 8 [Tursiops truncatus]XP_019781161.1 gem-associated protein 8 [Tursiops truncatus]XP_019781163.1 gem-associated protein 8 [Tursiops truncatus]XP_033705103.1 gem-associated protein 8 [Tursiops truncatus]XP_059859006.1 gem-associated protein 8 [Delphinus delphis]